MKYNPRWFAHDGLVCHIVREFVPRMSVFTCLLPFLGFACRGYTTAVLPTWITLLASCERSQFTGGRAMAGAAGGAQREGGE